MISITDLRFSYTGSGFCLDVESLRIEAGAKVAIVGPSGSGKTTLLNLICGISSPDSGCVSVDGQNVGALTAAARRDFRVSRFGMVFQQFELVEYLNVVDNITLPYMINHSLPEAGRRRERAVQLATELGLADKVGRYPGQLSQGEQQRVAICRAMIANPEIILADEPTGNLDPANKQKILDILFERCASNQQTLLVVTHDMNIVGGFDRIIDFEQFRQAEGVGHGVD